MAMAANHGCTKPTAANGVIKKCQATDPCRFCKEIRRVFLIRACTSLSCCGGQAVRPECGAATAVGTAIDRAHGQLITNNGTNTCKASSGRYIKQATPKKNANNTFNRQNQKTKRM